ncbi:MAG: hypothetical protein A4E61_01244 [Syntrophorhabdus sp. PtaB.Bin184]|nr:MAG: hypothetical protein A4E61_01244 [Syntrophorhabdus sp. PtaB.Bin184]
MDLFHRAVGPYGLKQGFRINSASREPRVPGVSLKNGHVVQKDRQEPPYLLPYGVGAIFALIRGRTAGNDVVGVDLVHGDPRPWNHCLFPLLLDTKRIEIDNEKRNAAVLDESRQGVGRLSGQEKERDGQLAEAVGDLLEAAEHETVLSQCRPGERIGETEHDDEGKGVREGRLLREEERPVVGDPLVTAHPVCHGPLARPTLPDAFDSLRQYAHLSLP